MSRNRNASVLRLMSLAAIAGLGHYRLTPDDTLAGGGGGDDKTKDKGKAKDDADKVTLTTAERDKLVADARAEAKREADEQRKREQADAEKADLEKRGETQKLLDQEREDRKAADAERAELRLKLRRAEVKDQLRKHLDEKHKDYASSLDDIALHVAVEADTKDDEVARRIEAAAKGFVARNPRGRMNVAPAPANNKPRPTGRDNNEDGDRNKPRTSFTGAAARF